jgi:hypothetical protein
MNPRLLSFKAAGAAVLLAGGGLVATAVPSTAAPAAPVLSAKCEAALAALDDEFGIPSDDDLAALEQLFLQYEDLLEKGDKLNAQLAEAEEQLRLARLAAPSGSLSDLKNALANAEEELAAAEKALADAQAADPVVPDAVEEAEAALEDAKAAVSEAQRDVDAAQEVEKREDAVQSLQAELDAIDGGIVDIENTLDELFEDEVGFDRFIELMENVIDACGPTSLPGGTKPIVVKPKAPAKAAPAKAVTANASFTG